MDEKSGEQPNPDMNRAIVNACRLVVDEIAAKENFTPEEALDLAGRFIAYEGDYELWYEDSARRAGITRVGSRPEDWHEGNLEKEAALFKAQNGDYTGVKGLLRRYATNLEETGAHEVLDTSHWNTFDKKFSRMADVLPDHGKPYFPPPPPVVKR